ncbi:MAG: alcohol dehydrogenase family protein [Acidimicrobiia bacterium]|nr:alcohol dehydrogenase family protein [Acidimicrobiia bacterium]
MLPAHMTGVVLEGHGGFDQLSFRTDLPVPSPGPTEVCIRVGAAGVNNTDINTRIGWYSKSVTSGSSDAGDSGFGDEVDDDGGWSGEGLTFPRIQGADAAGTVVAVGADVDESRIGERVLVRTMQTAYGNDDPTACITMGSEIDGGFAQFLCVESMEAFAIDTHLTDIELASFPCAYSTAEGVLHRADVKAGERVLITGASGGVGSAAIQLATRRGAEVIAVASSVKWVDLEPFGPDQLVDRNADLVAELGAESIDVVVDVVAGSGFGALLEVVKKQGRYATCGAIAGPIVDLDVRTLYLKDLTLIGCTYQPREVFENLIGYIERAEIRPIVAASYPLEDIVEAQKVFLEKRFVGKLVLIVPAASD